MDRKNYEYYTASDFAKDEYFQQWILCPDLKNNSFWQTWMREHPESRQAIDNAVLLVRSVNFRTYNLSVGEKDRIWDSIWDKMPIEEVEEVVHLIGTETTTGDKMPIEEVEVVPFSSASNIYWKWNKVWKYAAAIIGFVVVLAIWKAANHSPLQKSITFNENTKSGEVKRFILPDSSEVTLNANSELVFSNREVWLKGEAFFHVKHTTDSKAFLVHTYDDLSVKVLGTRFNVNTFGKKISVVLQQGSVLLNISDSNKNETKLYLNPGEMLTYNKEIGVYSKSKVETEQYVSWTSGRLIMDHYTLNDACTFMLNVFGKKMIINDSSLLKSSISGSMPIIYKTDTMLLQFGKAFQLHFKERGDEIWVAK